MEKGQAVALYKQGKTIREIAQILNISNTKAWQLCKKAGVSFRGARDFKLTKEELEHYYTDLSMSGLEIGRKFGYSGDRVLFWVRKYGIPTREFTTKGRQFRNRKLSEEHKQKLREWHTGRSLGPKHKAKVVRALLEATKRRTLPNGTIRAYHNGGYLEIKVGSKWVYLHRHVMEKHLGRKLGKTEVVHHKDRNPQNNKLDNLVLMASNDHLQMHSKKAFLKKGYSLSYETLKKYNLI